MARADRAARVAKGQRGAEDCGEACGPMHAVPPALLLGPLGRELTDTLVEHRSLAPFAPLGR